MFQEENLSFDVPFSYTLELPHEDNNGKKWSSGLETMVTDIEALLSMLVSTSQVYLSVSLCVVIEAFEMLLGFFLIK